jgi:chemotaxis protein histidine kinase CheA/CheY-like chemotaxis protein
MDTSAFTGKFVEEARDRLKSLGNALVRLEAQPQSAEIIADIFRDAHSLKGSAQMLGFVDISHIAHQLEDLFVAARRDVRVIDARAFDLVFRSLDLIAARVEELARGKTTPDASQHGEVPSEPAAPPPRRRPAAGQSLRVAIEKLDSLTHLAPEMVIQSLKASERHHELRRVEFSIARLRDRVREARLAPPARSRIAELGEYADTLDSITRRMRSLVTNFSDDQARLTLITEELRQHVIDLTMLPVGTVFDTFPRAVRDLARAFDKDVELTMTGRETELEKRVIEKIADPLVHLVRNAIDHGLEQPEERKRAGKPPAGTLLIAAEQHGNRCHITVRDDGRGIDPAAIRAAAIRKGLASSSELEQWTNERLFNLIFEPGFSTRTETTDVSGRGVGMDVVRVVTDALSGSVRVQSELGRGTTVVLDLPLSLALLRVVLIEVNGEITAVPTSAIRRILHGAADTMKHGQMAEIEGESIPIVALTALLGQPASGATHAGETVLIVETRDGRLGVTVDAVIEEQELVFQELRGPLGDQLTIAGAALLGNGEIVPILDMQALYQRVAQSADAKIAITARPAPARESSGVLVVEDSLVAAEMHRGILAGAGYHVEVAQDGVEALEMLRGRQWDLVITDVDMPNMNGVELTAHLRADPRLRRLPVIIVSSRDSGDHRRTGFDAGADAYLAKGEFDQNEILELVRRFIAHGREGVIR